jgi:hypothetical protein
MTDLNPAPRLLGPRLSACTVCTLSSPIFLSYPSLNLGQYGRCSYSVFSGVHWCSQHQQILSGQWGKIMFRLCPGNPWRILVTKGMYWSWFCVFFLMKGPLHCDSSLSWWCISWFMFCYILFVTVNCYFTYLSFVLICTLPASTQRVQHNNVCTWKGIIPSLDMCGIFCTWNLPICVYHGNVPASSCDIWCMVLPALSLNILDFSE